MLIQEIFPNRLTQFIHQYPLYKKGTTAVLQNGKAKFSRKLENFVGHHGTSEGHYGKLPHCRRIFQALVKCKGTVMEKIREQLGDCWSVKSLFLLKLICPVTEKKL